MGYPNERETLEEMCQLVSDIYNGVATNPAYVDVLKVYMKNQQAKINNLRDPEDE